MGWLIYKDGDGERRTIEIPSEGRLVCGRGQQAEITLPGATVSRRHVVFRHRRDQDWVQDAGSRNGSMLNGQPLTRSRRLADGDSVEVGAYRLFYSLRDPASAQEDDETDLDELRQDSAALVAQAPEARAAEHLFEDGRRWRQVTLVGRGGMGEVYRAFDRDLGELVAVKRLRPRTGGPTEILVRLHAREAAIGRTLDHPNVVRVLEDGVHEGDAFLLLEWVEGRSLDRELRDGTPSLGASLELLRQIALGLQAAHDMGVVHADLKPANLLILPQIDEYWESHNLGILESPDDPVDDDELPDELAAEITRRAGLPDRPDLENRRFVGRDAELAFLEKIAGDAAKDDAVRWVLLLGDPGVGKRSLIEEFRKRMPETPVSVHEELTPPPSETRGLHVTMLPAALPSDPKFLRDYEFAARAGVVCELFLTPFLRGQAIRLVEQVVGHAPSARAFVDAVEKETGGFPARILDALARSIEEGAWIPSGANYRFQGNVFHADEAAATRRLFQRLDHEEKGFRDLLELASPLGSSMDFEILQEATRRESATLYYLLNHGVSAGFLHRDAHGCYRFAVDGLRQILESRLDPKVRTRVVRAALAPMGRRLESGGAPLRLYLDAARLEREEGRLGRAFRWFLQGTLAARNAYERASFIECIDAARECLREEEGGRASRSMGQALEDFLGPAGRGFSGLDRLRRLPTRIRVKIADFGIARRTGIEVPDDDEIESPWGTPRYMSPEQVRRVALTTASDIYSLGIVARELLEGRHPLGDLRGRGALGAILDGIPSDLANKALFLPEELRALLRTMLKAEATLRPSAGDVATQIQALQVRLSLTEY